jgi:cell division septum initiation protein DivIVA
MSIKGYVDELEQLQAEIKRNNSRNRALRMRVKDLETNIKEYLAQKGQHGVKYKGRAIILENKERRPPKKKKEKEADVISLLEELGVEDPNKAYTRIQDVQKGDPIDQQKIKFRKLPKF